MLTKVSQISPHTIIYRERLLPMAGHVLVSEGEEVTADTVIAEAVLPSKVITLDLCRGLGLGSSEVNACLVRVPGEELKEGDLIAQCERSLTRNVRAPFDGLLLDVSQGQAVIAAGKVEHRITAGLPGLVTTVVPEYGAFIKTEGSLLQGVWGNGQTAAGILQVKGGNESEKKSDTTAEEPGYPGRILALRSCPDESTLNEKLAQEVTGLIIGWLHPDLMAEIEGLQIPVIVLQGFGDQPLDPECWEILSLRAGGSAVINAASPDLYRGSRPEVLIPEAQGGPEPGLGFQLELAVGQRVRILSGVMTGQTGRVLDLNTSWTFENGLVFPAVSIKTVGGEIVQVPQQNVVILG